MIDLIQKPYWYLRHGETEWNVQGLSQGRTDIPLNKRGELQAIKAGDVLARELQPSSMPITHIVTSPLVRARKTAELAAEAIARQGGPRLEITEDVDLQEVNFGDREGKPMGNWYDSWIAGDYTPPNGEPFAELKARGIKAINAAHKQGVPLIVSHGAMFRAVRAAMHMPPNVRLPNATPLWITFKAEPKIWDIAVLEPEKVD
ncbi:histidine phosphatase family protein [Entomobacter blattae]|uniref:2,3-bisphosphoglycerate-dependent phosphoglycerate mutase n=1 Tax=Entomobacter blattae TaxID=2762277 RepID=A0A7H1NQ93_9PROT|nr:histidine phosphatase family protein [Entomobacter blattae]QNT77953.1 2,3-bisphosphoglycerate-dependent phosphoglycerate mutase [Entomobacter blattae]